VLSYVNEQDFVAINSEFERDPVADYDRGIFLPGFGWPSYFKMQLNIRVLRTRMFSQGGY